MINENKGKNQSVVSYRIIIFAMYAVRKICVGQQYVRRVAGIRSLRPAAGHGNFYAQ